jgi:DNA-directed RNA polymerase specialized sigma24 family protein
MLRHVEGLELGEVAFQVGCSLATVKRAVARVQLELEHHFGTEIFQELK